MEEKDECKDEALKADEGFWRWKCNAPKRKKWVIRDSHSKRQLLRYSDMQSLSEADLAGIEVADDPYRRATGKQAKRQSGRYPLWKKAYCHSPNDRKCMTLAQLATLEQMFRVGTYTVSDMSRRLQCGVTNIYKKMAIFRKTNGQLVDYFLHQNPAYLQRVSYEQEQSKLIIEAVIEVVQANPKLYIPQIRHVLQEQYGLRTSQSKVSKVLREHKYVKKKPQRIYIQTNTEANIERRQQYCEVYLQQDPTKCLFLDECGINNRIRREKGWVRRGSEFHCEQPADGANRYSVLAAMSFEKVHEVQIKCGGVMNGEDMATFIEERIADKYADYVLVLDNARIHKTPQVRESLARNNIKYLFLPPYSPLLNPIENVFHQLKCIIRTLRFHRPGESLKQCVEDAVEQIKSKTFVNYQRRIQQWAQKGVRREKFCQVEF